MLGRVVEATGGLVEQDATRVRGQHDRQRERQPLPLGEVAGVRVVGSTPGTSRSSTPRAVPGAGAGVAVALTHSAATESR